jgi:iron only hydrogenase large subunit-like protein
VSLFKTLGVEYVFDTSFSREFSLLESAAEFVARYKNSISLPLPMLASACPGWICYAEKTHGDFVLPYISTTKSPQQIMGSIVKNYFSSTIGQKADNIYHCAIMPCYDKKLEASRDDFYNDIMKTRDVDCVLTSVEILDILAQKNIDFKALPDSTIPSLYVYRKYRNLIY